MTVASRLLMINLSLFLVGVGQRLSSMEEKERQLDLQTAIGLTLAESQELRNGRFSLESSQLQRKLTFQALFPSFSLTFSNENLTIHNAADSESIGVQLSVIQPLFQGGRVAGTLRLQKSKIRFMQKQLAVKIAQITSSCYSAYYSLLIQERKVELHEEILVSAREQLAISRLERELGKIREIDFLGTELEFQSLVQELEKQHLALNEAAYNLRKLLGLSPRQSVSIIGTIPDDYFGIEFAHPDEMFIALAMNSNPQVILGALELEQKTIEFRMARSQWLPTLSVEGSVSFSGNGLPLQRPDYEVKLNIELPLPWISFSGYAALTSSPTRNFGNSEKIKIAGPGNINYRMHTKTATMELVNAKQNYETLLEDLRFQVQSSLSRYHSRRKSLHISHKQVSILKHQMEILSLEVNLGASTRLKLVNAQNEYIKHVLNLHEDILELLLTERSLEQLIGLPFETLGKFKAP